MNTETSTSEYMLLFRGTQWDKDLPNAVVQDVMTRWMAWFDDLTAAGKAKTGQPLQRQGKIISGRARTVADGPFAESKEAVAGYFLLEAGSLEEAVEIGQQCPALDYGMMVEVRPMAVCCGVQERLNEDASVLAGAGV